MNAAVRSIVLSTYLLGACASTRSPAPQAPAGQATAGAPVRQEPDGHGSREEAAEGERVARQVLHDAPGGAWKAGGYKWLTVGRLYWVKGPLEVSRLVAVVGDAQAPTILTGDIAALQGFLAMQLNGRLPAASALNDIAQLVKDAVVGPGGSIATVEFFESQRRSGLQDWLKGRQRDPAELKKVCSGIRRSLNKNEWTLEFNIINTEGGVDVVRASGNASPLQLRQVSIGVVKTRGEFYYPLEG